MILFAYLMLGSSLKPNRHRVPDTLDPVRFKCTFVRDQRGAFNLSLSDEHPIEWISVWTGKITGALCVLNYSLSSPTARTLAQRGARRRPW